MNTQLITKIRQDAINEYEDELKKSLKQINGDCAYDAFCYYECNHIGCGKFSLRNGMHTCILAGSHGILSCGGCRISYCKNHMIPTLFISKTPFEGWFEDCKFCSDTFCEKHEKNRGAFLCYYCHEIEKKK